MFTRLQTGYNSFRMHTLRAGLSAQRRDQKKDTEQAEHTNLGPGRCRICNQSKIVKLTTS
jgi:hypothetical protein